jgi:hypothetical protein
MVDSEPKTKRERILKHLGNVCMAFVSLSLMTSLVSAVDPSEAANKVIGSEGGRKAVIDAALKVAKSKPAKGNCYRHTIPVAVTFSWCCSQSSDVYRVWYFNC